ncbi:DUF6577 family protein [Hymenobacter lucidus]|uniref:DUF2063 domain-containing protein n=1 Tax=Hymenobacter lucidus TaxID=2880930 RepID=A0ABS8AYU1_9BACT|nr:DUF6577 family protein [Hymenobacter lucidus]MCB2410975.1 hypothetical protein [Hymenobacter lucidus]
MKSATAPVDRVLRAWPQLRGFFRGRTQLSEAELLTFFQQVVPAVTATVWPSVRQGLLRSQLLHEVGLGLFSFEAPLTQGFQQPVVRPEWLAVWQQLQAGLALPLGCLWSTRWLQPFLPDLPSVLVVEVRWAELRWAQDLLASVSPPDPLVVRVWQRFSPVRQVRGIPTARLEKMLVDVTLMPEVAGVPSDAALVLALARLQASQSVNQELLLSYAARCGAEPRWSELLQAVQSPS